MDKVLFTSITLLAAFTFAGCSNEADSDLIDPTDAVELGITAGVSLTKSAIQGGDGDAGKQNGTASTIMQNVAIRATGTDYTSVKNNDNAIYTQSGGVWTREGTSNKIMLTSNTATIYAFHPAYPFDANGNKTADPITVSGTLAPTGGATIPVSIFEGGNGASGSPTQKVNSTITDADNSTSGIILSAPGETDYLYEGSATRPTASNGKSEPTIDEKVDLNMKHALAMLSFRIYKDESYKNAGLLTVIKLDNSSGTVLNKGTSATMDIATGAVAVTGSAGAVFTRFIGENGVTLGNLEVEAHRYSILVFPETGTSAKNTVRVTFTIDDADYTVNLPSEPIQWAAGKNYLYTAKLSGKELNIQNVKVAAWGAESGGNITVN